ncbi:hypothetical protein CRX72_29825 [Pantoea sp. BRM17]|nr:hypothetical protein CRX72_29825 [Pantoea sp. BRM17]
MAHRLGIHHLKTELEELGFEALYPNRFRVIKEVVKAARFEDTPATYQDMEQLFGKSVAELVEGVSKLDKLKFRDKKEAQAENFRKMIMAMVQDIRVILIKLADR